MINQSAFSKIAGISGALAVALGAYGAHANVNRADMAGSLLLAGMVVFSGSCYIAALAEKRSYGRLAPFGGTMMIIGWAVMAL